MRTRPVYARHVAHTAPANHVLEQIRSTARTTGRLAGGYIDKKTGKPCTVSGRLRFSAIPIGPTWFGAGGKFVLGADATAATSRSASTGRTSLFVGIGSSVICIFFAVILALIAAYFSGTSDFVITRFFDLFLRSQ